MQSSKEQLEVLIIGAGIGGLSAGISIAEAGHKVLIVESAPELIEIGAGVQLTPNATKILAAWGLGEQLDRQGSEPTFLAVRRYRDGKVLSRDDDFDKKMHQRYQAPFIDIHRANLQTMMYKKVVELGVQVRLNSLVESVDHANATVTLKSGEQLSADLVVGADGLKSLCRESLLGRKDPPLPTGDLAYRIVLTIDQVTDADLKDWVAKPSVHFWIGPESHAVGYSMKHGTMYNLVLLCPDDLPDDVSRQEGNIEEMQTLFKNWDPILQRFLGYVDKVEKWRLMHHDPMESWSNGKGNFLLIGDACHPMLPYLAQGANSSVEDGAVLGRVLNVLRSKETLRDAIVVFEKVRKGRSDRVARETFGQRHDFHLVDGPEQEARDKLLLSQLEKEVKGKFPSRWTCPEVQPWLWGYDAFAEADAALQDVRHLHGVVKAGL